MEPQSPVRLHGRKSDNLSILPTDLNRTRSSDEVEVQHTTQTVILQILPLFRLINKNIHSIRVQKEDSMGARSPMLEIDGMVTVEVRAVGDAVAVLGPEGADVVCRVEAEGVRVLA
jgi:hypothetical protein